MLIGQLSHKTYQCYVCCTGSELRRVYNFPLIMYLVCTVYYSLVYKELICKLLKAIHPTALCSVIFLNLVEKYIHCVMSKLQRHKKHLTKCTDWIP